MLASKKWLPRYAGFSKRSGLRKPREVTWDVAGVKGIINITLRWEVEDFEPETFHIITDPEQARLLAKALLDLAEEVEG